jgi:hypothetical protein
MIAEDWQDDCDANHIPRSILIHIRMVVRSDADGLAVAPPSGYDGPVATPPGYLTEMATDFPFAYIIITSLFTGSIYFSVRHWRSCVWASRRAPRGDCPLVRNASLLRLGTPTVRKLRISRSTRRSEIRTAASAIRRS